MKFPYRRYRVRIPSTFRASIAFRPEIPATLIGPAGTESVDALVDTGADVTLIPRSMGLRIGATIDDSVLIPMGGIAGQALKASPGDVEIEIRSDGSPCRWSTRVAFVNYPAGAEEITIFGHVGFLEFFRVLFDGPANELEIQPTSRLPTQPVASHP